jgi:hypothetical protein
MEEKTSKWLQELTNPGGLLVAHKTCLCGKFLRVDEHIRRWHSGVVNYDETLCGDCRKDYGETARIVCLGCKRLQGFVNPHKASTGFQFVTKQHYHIAKCPKCDPNITATPVLEHEQWCRHRKITTKPNWDLVQEIEQKTLQGKAAADKLRAEINSSKI